MVGSCKFVKVRRCCNCFVVNAWHHGVCVNCGFFFTGEEAAKTSYDSGVCDSPEDDLED
jgi:hypothetical protein